MKKPKTTILQLRKANWARTEVEVVTKLRLLHAIVDKLEPTEMNDRIANDLILPTLKLIGKFCVAVTIHEASLN